MITSEQLRKMSELTITEVNKDDLVDITTIEIDPDEPVETRMQKYLEQVKNPYMFKVGETCVRVRFNKDGPELKDLLVRYFAGLKNR